MGADDESPKCVFAVQMEICSLWTTVSRKKDEVKIGRKCRCEKEGILSQLP